jgi:hypothetical protein
MKEILIFADHRAAIDAIVKQIATLGRVNPPEAAA